MAAACGSQPCLQCVGGAASEASKRHWACIVSVNYRGECKAKANWFFFPVLALSWIFFSFWLLSLGACLWISE